MKRTTITILLADARLDWSKLNGTARDNGKCRSKTRKRALALSSKARNDLRTAAQKGRTIIADWPPLNPTKPESERDASYPLVHNAEQFTREPTSVQVLCSGAGASRAHQQSNELETLSGFSKLNGDQHVEIQAVTVYPLAGEQVMRSVREISASQKSPIVDPLSAFFDGRFNAWWRSEWEVKKPWLRRALVESEPEPTPAEAQRWLMEWEQYR